MKKSFKYLTFIISIIALIFTLSACNYESIITLSDLSLSIAPNESIKHLTGDKSEDLLTNVDRGFRLETYYTLGSGRDWPTNVGSDGYKMLNDEIDKYKDDKSVEIQVYIYLTEYIDKPLDDKALNQMKAFFEYIKSKNLNMLLRFAYDHTQGENNSPTQQIILEHLKQIKQFNNRNLQLIKDTLTAYQFGMIGAWGEWGATFGKYNEKTILNAMIDAFPDGTYFQGRYMRVVNQTDNNSKSEYVGYHNDFLVGRPHPWNTAGDKYKSKDYKKFIGNVQYRLNDGEMPWGGYTDEPDEKVDGLNFLKQMREHSMGTLSIKHNYIEDREGKDGVMRDYHNIARWKTEYVTAEILKANKLPYYDSWFKDSNGNTIKRSIYEYLRDYLGYVLLLDNLEIKKIGDNTEISFVITNYGLGTPLSINNMEIVVCEDSSKSLNNSKSYYVSNYDCKKLVTYGQQKITYTIPGDITNKSIGIKLSKGNHTIKTANDIPYINGVNFIL